MQLRCGVYGRGSVLTVDVDATVNVPMLQQALFDAMGLSSQYPRVYPSDLVLYVARTADGAFLEETQALRAMFRVCVTSPEFPQMQASWTLDMKEARFDGPRARLDWTLGYVLVTSGSECATDRVALGAPRIVPYCVRGHGDRDAADANACVLLDELASLDTRPSPREPAFPKRPQSLRSKVPWEHPLPTPTTRRSPRLFKPDIVLQQFEPETQAMKTIATCRLTPAVCVESNAWEEVAVPDDVTLMAPDRVINVREELGVHVVSFQGDRPNAVVAAQVIRWRCDELALSCPKVSNTGVVVSRGGKAVGFLGGAVTPTPLSSPALLMTLSSVPRNVAYEWDGVE